MTIVDVLPAFIAAFIGLTIGRWLTLSSKEKDDGPVAKAQRDLDEIRALEPELKRKNREARDKCDQAIRELDKAIDKWEPDDGEC